MKRTRTNQVAAFLLAALLANADGYRLGRHSSSRIGRKLSKSFAVDPAEALVKAEEQGRRKTFKTETKFDTGAGGDSVDSRGEVINATPATEYTTDVPATSDNFAPGGVILGGSDLEGTDVIPVLPTLPSSDELVDIPNTFGDGDGRLSDDYNDNDGDGIPDHCQRPRSTSNVFGKTSPRAVRLTFHYEIETRLVMSPSDMQAQILPALEDKLGSAMVPLAFDECAAAALAFGKRRGRSLEMARSSFPLSRSLSSLEGVKGLSMSPEDIVVRGFCENTTGAPCTKVEGLITLHLYENANEASVSDSSQMAIELVMDAGDLNDAHPEIVDVSYIGAGPTIPVADNIKLGPEKAEGPTGSQGSGSNTLAIAVGSSAGLLGLALIGLGVKMRRDKEDLEELEDERLDPQDVDEMDSAKEVALDGQTAYDMHKLNIPTDETFGSTTMPVDGSTTAVGDDTTLHESRFMEQSNASRIMASLDEVDEYGEDVNTSVASGHGSNISVGHSNTVDLV